MRLVGIKSLKSGDILGAAVRTSSGKVILSAETVLIESYIQRFKQMGVYKVYIKDDDFDDIEIPDDIDDRVRNEAIMGLKETYTNLHKDRPVDEYLIKGIAKGIVDQVLESRQKGVSMLSLNLIDDYIIEHSINISILSVFMGNHMNYNYNQLCDLAAGAMIHDVARQNKKEEDLEHVQKGFDVMRKCRGLSLHSSIVCYEHHENFDGSGYPRKLKGAQISEFTKIIRVADLYDDLLHGFGNGDVPMMPHQAYENILAAAGTVIDPAMVEVFRDTIIFFPNGCTVLLSNGLTGVVVRQNLGIPQRPVVRTFSDSGIIGEVDLMQTLTLSINDVVIV